MESVENLLHIVENLWKTWKNMWKTNKYCGKLTTTLHAPKCIIYTFFCIKPD